MTTWASRQGRHSSRARGCTTEQLHRLDPQAMSRRVRVDRPLERPGGEVQVSPRVHAGDPVLEGQFRAAQSSPARQRVHRCFASGGSALTWASPAWGEGTDRGLARAREVLSLPRVCGWTGHELGLRGRWSMVSSPACMRVNRTLARAARTARNVSPACMWVGRCSSVGSCVRRGLSACARVGQLRSKPSSYCSSPSHACEWASRSHRLRAIRLATPARVRVDRRNRSIPRVCRLNRRVRAGAPQLSRLPACVRVDRCLRSSSRLARAPPACTRVDLPTTGRSSSARLSRVRAGGPIPYGFAKIIAVSPRVQHAGGPERS